MLKALFKKIFCKPVFCKPKKQIISRDLHPISRKNISDHALKVLYRLNNHGYKAYLVGGSVRDLLLNLKPKDFDIATDARPDEIQAVFRNCRLIGRRFRLAHIYFGQHLIEVATFRAGGGTDNEVFIQRSKSGVLLRDNVYGTLEEDVIRRDFTINALYYNVEDFSIVDYVGGVKDIQDKVIRIIGDPQARFREDPVRMLRAIRFAAKLNFTIEKNTAKPIYELAHLLEEISSARIFDEVIKLFFTGKAQATFDLLVKYDVFMHLFPQTAECMKEDETAQAFINNFLVNTDKRVKEEKSVLIAFLFAALYWSPMLKMAENEYGGEKNKRIARQLAARELFKNDKGVVLPKKLIYEIEDILDLQELLENISKKAIKLVHHYNFRAAYDFFLLRVGAGEKLKYQAKWWESYLSSDDENKMLMIKGLTKTNSGKTRKRKSNSKKPPLNIDSN